MASITMAPFFAMFIKEEEKKKNETTARQTFEKWILTDKFSQRKEFKQSSSLH